MRSNDLARIAGVTIKTLRHYHKIGVLPEPGRDANNYRSYAARHLARLLRIRRLSALGLSLEEIGETLAGEGERADDILGTLDRKLGEEIARLSHKRDMIAHLRSSRSDPDTPVELAGYFRQFTAFAGDEIRETIREQMVLLELAVGREGMSLLTDYLDRLTAPDLVGPTLDIAERFYRLGADSSAAEKADLIDRHIALFTVVAPEYLALAGRPKPHRRTIFLIEHILTSLNPAQREVFVAMIERLAALSSPAGRS